MHLIRIAIRNWSIRSNRSRNQTVREADIRTFINDLIFLLPLLSLTIIGAPGCSKNNPTTSVRVSVPITGIVVDSTTNIPVPFATVELGSSGVTTSSMGTYSFSYSQIQSGTYTIKVVANGYYAASKQIQVISDTTQIVDFAIKALQDTINLSAMADAHSYSFHKFSFDSLPAVQCTNGIMSHDVKVTVQLDEVPQPVRVIVVDPRGSYEFEQDTAKIGFSQAFLSYLCGDLVLVVYNWSATQVTYSEKVILDFSNYPISSDTVPTNVMVPFDYPSIASDSSASFSRFLEANMGYQLRMVVLGGSNNDIHLVIYDPSSAALFDQSVNNGYVSQTFTAAKDGFYTFKFSNGSSVVPARIVSGVTSSRSVSGILVISH